MWSKRRCLTDEIWSAFLLPRVEGRATKTARRSARTGTVQGDPVSHLPVGRNACIPPKGSPPEGSQALGFSRCR